MSSEIVRFVHTADFHLEVPLFGVAYLPTELRSLFRSAAQQAARRVFDVAIEEKVDFVILAGDIIQPSSSGVAAAARLREQFERLDEAGIPIYWLSGRVDEKGRWPKSVLLPENVHRFVAGQADIVTYSIDGNEVVHIIGVGHGIELDDALELVPDDDEIPVIVVAHGRISKQVRSQAEQATYWALGGKHRATPIECDSTAWYAGTNQGRSPREGDSHGCLVVELTLDGSVQVEKVPTDVARFRQEHFFVPPEAGQNDLRKLLTERERELARRFPDQSLLVTWELEGPNRLARQWSQSEVVQDALDSLNGNKKANKPNIWHLGIEWSPTFDWTKEEGEQETLLAEFIHMVALYDQDESLPLPWETLLKEEQQTTIAGLLVEVDNRSELLSQVAELGRQLLTPETP